MTVADKVDPSGPPITSDPNSLLDRRSLGDTPLATADKIGGGESEVRPFLGAIQSSLENAWATAMHEQLEVSTAKPRAIVRHYLVLYFLVTAVALAIGAAIVGSGAIFKVLEMIGLNAILWLVSAGVLLLLMWWLTAVYLQRVRLRSLQGPRPKTGRQRTATVVTWFVALPVLVVFLFGIIKSVLMTPSISNPSTPVWVWDHDDANLWLFTNRMYYAMAGCIVVVVFFRFERIMLALLGRK